MSYEVSHVDEQHRSSGVVCAPVPVRLDRGCQGPGFLLAAFGTSYVVDLPIFFTVLLR